ncbi:MAG: hypothetical protein K9G05_07245 [Candidatus Nanopelagicales bacterium]|nr:hypothetical protein [Candidatus Nanopelagicales bacterium]MCF8539182.1 hypothetical protein [Candidatus Nanopelagicales bacterium]MCF8551852.1 hypothetical protein [Candidatus Nanopelagicales bacterium]
MAKGNSEVRPDPHLPRPDRLDPGSTHYFTIMSAHESACHTGDAGYLDPFTGLFVMTSDHHLERGFCCGRGCRHCPFT